ncbi:5-deoxy-glucuronate isomerase [Aquicella siphonis]|uniref:5-deoxy-glucuronate isomerase n=1 Tax=Aquicella siphonis TaxID=254247 RepID=A0A5E4PF59_9COXI|nr:5-deoxy-glucuronate isomerase [Aquicella siphonis]
MQDYLIRHPQGFPFGYTAITRIGEQTQDTGINFGILKLKSGETTTVKSIYESAYLLIQGHCIFSCAGVDQHAERHSCFNEDPYALHVAPEQDAAITAVTACEFAVSQVENTKSFQPRIFSPANLLESEHRGKGLLNDTAYRLVRTIFDLRNSPDANLVLGEVITAPGRWSSYPPHHHDQPEIYHYRFTEPQGYGHAECGEQLFKVREYDTYKILDANDHSQAAAPGYGMYYIWVIRHLEGKPYTAPEFTREHSWTRSPEADSRVWKGTF